MFKEKLKELRIKENLTQADLAEKIFVSRSAVAKWEQGRGLPSMDSLELLCKVFNVDEDELLDKKEPIVMYNKIKTKWYWTVNLNLIAGVVLTLLFVLLIVIGISTKIEGPKYNSNYLRDFDATKLSLQINETIDIEEYISDLDLEYDKIESYVTEDYSLKKYKLTPNKLGYYPVYVTLFNKNEKQSYSFKLFDIYCYDINNMIEINNIEDFYNINNNLSGHYLLNSNLDFTNIEDFKPIASEGKRAFKGFLINPNNYTIRNLTIKSSSQIEHDYWCCAGLFREIDEGYIDNLILDNLKIDVSDSQSIAGSAAGALAYLITNSLIINCKFNGEIVAQTYVGGIVGLAGDSTFVNNVFNGNVIQKKFPNDMENTYGAGGLAGWFNGCSADNLSQFSCCVKGNIINANVYSEYVASKVAGYYFGDCALDNFLFVNLYGKETYEIGKSTNN